MKKILSLVLAIMMVLSMASTAFAGTFEDVKDSKFADAIETLYALGVVSGYDNNGELSYRPDNAIKRGEFAKLLVEALGLGTMADGSASSFADVKGHWADGYIAIANGLQIVEGKGNGMFAPDANVTYENAMAMILRTLGYTNAAVNKGVNAYNGTAYMALAKKVGLLEGLTIKSGNITRGEIAMMLYNALEANNVNATEKGYETLTSILLDNIATHAEVKVELATLTKGHLVDLTPYLYQTIEVYKNGDKIAYVYKSNSTVKEGTITKVEGSVIFVKDAAGKTAEFNTTGSSIIVNADLKADGVNLAAADVVKVILEGTTVKAVITEKVSAMTQVSKAYRAGATVLGTIQLPKTTAGKVDLSKVTVTGVVDAIEDIEADDVVVAYHSAGKNANVTVKLLVVRDTVEGRITKVSGDDYYINDVAYALNSTDDAITLGAKGVFYLDNNGDIAYFTPVNTAPTSSSYVMINSTTKGYETGGILIKDAKIEFVNAKNEKVSLLVNGKTIVTKVDTTTAAAVTGGLTTFDSSLVKGQLATYKAKDGVVTEITLVDASQTAKELDQNSKTFMPSANLVVFHYYSDKVNVIALADLKAKFTADYITNDKGEITVIVVKASIAATTPDTYAIITNVEDILDADDEQINLITAYVNGEVKTFNTTEIDAKYADAIGKVVKLLFTNNVVSDIQVQNDTARTVDSIRTDRFLSGSTWYVLADNAVVYVMKDATTIERIGSIDDLDYANAEVKVFDTDGKASTGYEVIIVSYK